LHTANNFFTKFYNASPVGITVEGSNTLTRGLIIFGQGLNKSHPYIFPIFQTIQENDLEAFKQNFNSLLNNIMTNYGRLQYIQNKGNPQVRLEIATVKFSILSNYIALLGGKIKQKQMISGNMADILSNIYLGYSLVWYHHNYEGSTILRDECLNYLMQETEQKMNLILHNYPLTFLKPFLYPLYTKTRYTNLEGKNELYKHILANEGLNGLFNKDIYYNDTVLEKLMKLAQMDKTSQEYKSLYQDIIKVGEYKI